MRKKVAYDYPPEITIRKLLAMQICVPQDWSDHEIEMFAEEKNRCGTTHGWKIDKDLDKVPCKERNGFIHVVVQA